MTITVYVATNKLGSKCSHDFEIPDQEWAEMNEAEREKLCLEVMFNMIEWNWQEKVKVKP